VKNIVDAVQAKPDLAKDTAIHHSWDKSGGCPLPSNSLVTPTGPRPGRRYFLGIRSHRMAVTTGSALALVLERHADSRSISFDFTVLQLHVELDDFGDPEVSQGLAGTRNRGGCRLLPGFRARSDEFDDFIDIFRHDTPRIEEQ